MSTGRTALCGLLGDPVVHSLSPVMHSAAFAALGLDYAYLSFCVARQAVESALVGLRALGARGVNVTVPHKSAVLPFLDALDSTAERMGAVNTIVFTDGRAKGYNTDAFGFLQALTAAGFDPAGKKVAVLGAGGAAAAIAWALKNAGGSPVLVTRRTSLSRGRALARRLSLPAEVAELGKLRSVLDGVELLVNATGVGTTPHTDATLVPAELLRSGLTVFDVVYNPRETRLLREARLVGARTISGLEMLLYQGARSFELWTGKVPPIDIMRHAALGELGESVFVGRPVVLIGFMGSGKSVVSKALARRLGRRLLETDAMVERAAGKSIGRIFAEDGEAAFRRWEAVAVCEALAVPGAVVSCGGGVVLNAATAACFKEKAAVIYLKASPEVLATRLGHSRHRPLLQTGNRLAAITALLNERKASYEQAADITIDTSRLNVEGVADTIAAVIKSAGGAVASSSNTDGGRVTESLS
ncbi:MAG: shikimate dehydrogenase [Dehalococcoidia bacterium]|nr:shikimate dehydrogenase [Dehalococcoidia bacterium]